MSVNTGPLSISSIAVIRIVLLLHMRADVPGASAMNQAVIAHRDVRRISIVLTGRSGEYPLAVTKEAGVELNDLGVLRIDEVTG